MSLDSASHPIETAARSFTGTTAGLSTANDWRPLFASYSTIVLVANSDDVDIGALRANLPEDTLFVFFNKVYKVLDRLFDGNVLLAVRSGTGGPNIVARGEVGHVVSYFAPDRFLGIMCVRAGSVEKVTPASAFGGVPTGHLDLTDYFVDFYPSDHLPSSGFALAVWLCELDPGRKVMLAGFSGKRSERWKIFNVHDWTFEQLVQRLLIRSGRLTVADAATLHSYAAIMKRFPDIPAADISLTAAEILSERLEHVNVEIDKLISATSLNRSVEKVVRGLKPIEMVIRRLRRKAAGRG
jgi:hypothetical protein